MSGRGPRTRYARSGNLNIAYRVAGAGSHDITIVLPTLGTIEMLWDPPARGELDRLAEFARVVAFDRRGVGLSDPVDSPPTLEEQVDDVEAVLDAVGLSRTAIYSEAEGALMAIMYAATRPERVTHLVLFHGLARITWAPGYEWALRPEERRKRLIEPTIHAWGTGERAEELVPILAATDPDARDWWGRWERISASPSTVVALLELAGRMDVREILGQVQCPTLVLDRPDASALDTRHAEYLAANIPDARYMALPGRDPVSFGDGREALTDAIEEFITGTGPARAPKRALSTVMFTDIVDSTGRAAELGDSRWRGLLEAHDEVSRRAVSRNGGRAVKSTGDGLLASFEGPARGIHCAMELCGEARGLGLELRAGLHSGEVELMGDDLGGMAVHIGARIAAAAEPGEVLVSSTVRDLVVGSRIAFADRGLRELRGVSEPWHVYSVEALPNGG